MPFRVLVFWNGVEVEFLQPQGLMSSNSILAKTGVAFVWNPAVMNTTRHRVIPPASFSVSQPCSRIRVLVPFKACVVLPKTRTVERVTVRSKRFLEETDTCRNSISLKLEDYVTTAEGQDMRTKRGTRGGVKRLLVRDEKHIAKATGQRGRHRLVDRRGKARLRKALDFLGS